MRIIARRHIRKLPTLKLNLSPLEQKSIYGNKIAFTLLAFDGFFFHFLFLFRWKTKKRKKLKYFAENVSIFYFFFFFFHTSFGFLLRNRIQQKWIEFRTFLIFSWIHGQTFWTCTTAVNSSKRKLYLIYWWHFSIEIHHQTNKQKEMQSKE